MKKSTKGTKKTEDKIVQSTIFLQPKNKVSSFWILIFQEQINFIKYLLQQSKNK